MENGAVFTVKLPVTEVFFIPLVALFRQLTARIKIGYNGYNGFSYF